MSARADVLPSQHTRMVDALDARPAGSTDDKLSATGRVIDVLGHFRLRGVELWASNGQLHYKAPKGTLTPGEIQTLRDLRSEIVALLEHRTASEAGEARAVPNPRLERVPLTFSQLAHWHTYQLREGHAIRQIASATRLRGQLNTDALQKSFRDMVGRHEALRTRIATTNGIPTQEITKSTEYEFEIDDLSTLLEDEREVEVQRQIERLILKPVDLAVGPLFGVRLLTLGMNEHVLIVALEHIISDAYSMNILLRDLFATYTHIVRGRAVSLPTILVKFSDYAVWQRNAHQSWREKHGAYWDDYLLGSRRLRFPADQNTPAGGVSGWGSVPLQIGRALKAELREWCQLRRTTLVMSVFAAYVGIVLRWCNVSEGVIQYQSDGRVNSKMENTIGYFASTLFLRVQLLETDSFVDLVRRVTAKYWEAHEYVGLYDMASRVPQPEFTRNSLFNWVPQAPKGERYDLEGITCSPVHFEHPIRRNLDWDNEPSILLFDTEDEIVVSVTFPLSRFSIETMERFARNFLGFISVLLRQPERRVADISLL